MSERPILFSGAMVRALLDGTKTQTRRMVKFLGADVIDASGTVRASLSRLTLAPQGVTP